MTSALLLALLATTPADPLDGATLARLAEVWPEVHWASWAPLLATEGVADQAEDLLDARGGLLGAAVVLQHLRVTYRRPGTLTLCIYGAGPRALHWRRDCDYSRRVLGLRDLLRARLAGGGALALGVRR